MHTTTTRIIVSNFFNTLNPKNNNTAEINREKHRASKEETSTKITHSHTQQEIACKFFVSRTECQKRQIQIHQVDKSSQSCLVLSKS